jgi:hypothetical protein
MAGDRRPCVPVAVLWAYRSEKTPLSNDELQHLYKCNNCLCMLGLCHLSESLKEVERRRREELSSY